MDASSEGYRMIADYRELPHTLPGTSEDLRGPRLPSGRPGKNVSLQHSGLGFNVGFRFSGTHIYEVILL